MLSEKRSIYLKAQFSRQVSLQTHSRVGYPDNRGFPWHAKNEEKRKTSEDIVSKSCWAWRNITLQRGWSPISSLAILIRRAPFWPADMRTVHAQEWREGLKPVTQPVWLVWLVQTPGRLIAYTQQDIFWHDLFRGFSFLSIFRVPGKTSVIRVRVGIRVHR